jgi:hypothetical protein
MAKEELQTNKIESRLDSFTISHPLVDKVKNGLRWGLIGTAVLAAGIGAMTGSAWPLIQSPEISQIATQVLFTSLVGLVALESTRFFLPKRS